LHGDLKKKQEVLLVPENHVRFRGGKVGEERKVGRGSRQEHVGEGRNAGKHPGKNPRGGNPVVVSEHQSTEGRE